MKIAKDFYWEMGHRLYKYKGLCKNLHGHNYVVYITLCTNRLDDMDMVMDFYDLKKFADPFFERFDHAFLYNTTAKDEFEHDLAKIVKLHSRKIIELPFRFTAENMAKYFYNYLSEQLYKETDEVVINDVVVYETATSFAEYNESRYYNANK